MTNTTKLVAALVLFLIPGCGIGVVYFEPVGVGPRTGESPANFTVFDIDCKDGFEKTGGTNALGSAAGNYSISCTKDGQPMPGTVIGIFHAAPAAKGKWETYRKKVAAKARAKKCPAVAIRLAPPTVNQQGEAIGAFCIEP